MAVKFYGSMIRSLGEFFYSTCGSVMSAQLDILIHQELRWKNKTNHIHVL